MVIVNFRSVTLTTHSLQEYIPVGCVPFAAVAVGEGGLLEGCLPGGCLSGGVCPGVCLLGGVFQHALGQTPTL